METRIQWIKAHWYWVLTGVGLAIGLLGIGWGMSQLKTPKVTEQAQPLALTTASSSGSQRHGTSMAKSSATTSGYVDVKGAVKRPGLYRVKTSMRVADVLDLAQGLMPQADQQRVNLAAKVMDQQVIYVPAKGESQPPLPAGPANGSPSTQPASTSPSSATSSASGTATVNLNTADVAALQGLKGIGQKKAQKIIDYRQQHGAFKTVDDLKNVAGFGEKTIAKYQDQLTV